jgi:hypothetical protein
MSCHDMGARHTGDVEPEILRVTKTQTQTVIGFGRLSNNNFPTFE